MRNVVRRTWTEPIDRESFAAIAEFSEVYRGVIFRASTFLLAEWTGRRGHDKAMTFEKVTIMLEEELKAGVHCALSRGGWRHNRFGMPAVGRVRDLNRA
jgi:hypothetical protein